LIALFLTLILLASQLYDIHTDAIVSQEVFSLKTKKESDFHLGEVNVINKIFQLSGGILKVSAERGPDFSSKSIFSAFFDVNIVLRPDLKLSVSMSPQQLDSSSAARICLWLTNNTHWILLNYVSGFQEEDWTSGTYSYIFYKIGNGTDKWTDRQRSIWNDLLSKNPNFESFGSWRLIHIEFGVISYSSTTNNRMEVIFNADETSLYYERLANATVKTSPLNPNPHIALLMILDVVSVFCLLIFFAKK
jgi:hypothetical protein